MGLNSLGQNSTSRLISSTLRYRTLGASTPLYGVILALAKLTGNPTLFVHARVAQADGAIVGQHGEMPPVH
jgi:hypothetical protein